MLDALKNMTFGRGSEASDEILQLEALIALSREERATMGTMLTAMIARSLKMAPLSQSLEEASDKVTTVTAKLDDVVKRLNSLEVRTKELPAIERRILTLQETARLAEQTTEKAVGPGGELAKYHEAVQSFSQQLVAAQMTMAALEKERPALEHLRVRLRATETDVKQSVANANSLTGELEQIRLIAATIKQDLERSRESSREAREGSQVALATLKEVENKLAPLATLHELTVNTDEQLTALNSLCEHVTRKVRALKGQEQAVEHAVVQANRVNEMVWAMEVQINKLNEGMKQAAQAEDTIGRIEKLSAGTSAQMEAATKLNHEFHLKASKFGTETSAMLDAVRTEVTLLAGRKKELEVFNERMRALQLAVGDAEDRMEALATKDKNLIALTQRVDSLAQCFEALLSQADDLAKQQLSLEPLREQLAEVRGLAKNTVWQMDALRQSHKDLDLLRGEIQAFYASHAEITKLADKLESDRRSVEAFSERLTSFQAQTPRFEAKMDAILGKLTLVEDGSRKAARLEESVADLDAQLTRLSAREPFVEKLEDRLNGLNILSASVDRKLGEQLGRNAEVDAFKTACDGLGEQLNDAQHKLETVRRLQNSLMPVIADVNKLRAEITTIEGRLSATQFTEAASIEQEKRFAQLVSASRATADEVADRSRQMQVLADELAHATKIKDEMLSELDRVQSRQRETVSHIRSSEDQLTRAESMFKQFEQSTAQLSLGEKKLAAVESRLTEIKQLATEVEKNIAAIMSREQVISTVKSEVESVHEISARSKADLAQVIGQCNEVSTLKTRVDVLLSKIAETDERLVAIDARRKIVDEVEAKANGIAHLLDDVRINLETLGEQKAVVDHVSGKLESSLQEARNTVRTLQHERELAERIERGIKQLRERAA